MKTKITLLIQTILVLLFSTINNYSQTPPTITVSLNQPTTCKYSTCDVKSTIITNSFFQKIG